MGDFSRKGLLIGYASVVLLSLVPFVVLAIANVPIVDVGTPPYAVFAIAIAVVLIVLRPLWLVARLHPEPIRQLGRDLLNYAPWLLTSGITLLAIAETVEGALSIKQAIPYLNPFWADAALIRIDRILFFGHDAWQATHAVLPSGGTQVIDWLYAIWHPVKVAFCMAMILSFDRRLQLQAVLSFQLSWLLLGNLTAVSLSSVGPVFFSHFWGRDDFAPLIAQLHEGNASRNLFRQISAGSAGHECVCRRHFCDAIHACCHRSAGCAFPERAPAVLAMDRLGLCRDHVFRIDPPWLPLRD
ncbi:hypothetical protein GRF63_13545 [Erythrobacter sp. GH3-10]|uniref:Uncharacterized protein n=1 Tax=Aurantiacibacter rhizosphaerae TaxID=2691582 RepID=A0A844XEC6_9SPHN|nr:phosphatase PAP2 family protein [Aurantiacibacter rhizosphaerae]MWV28931.1 hypothetical protein [Aurantiacibacter rhizosphaerae]